MSTHENTEALSAASRFLVEDIQRNFPDVRTVTMPNYERERETQALSTGLHHAGITGLKIIDHGLFFDLYSNPTTNTR